MPNLTTTEAARILGVTPIRVRALCETGKLRATKHGRDWIITAKNLTRYSPRPVGRPKNKEK